MKRFHSIRTKILCSVVLMALVISTVVISLSYFTYKESMDAQYESRANEIAETVMTLLDSKEIANYALQAPFMSEEEKTAAFESEAYQNILETLQKIKQANNIAYLYMFYPTEEGYYYIFDADETEEAYSYAQFEHYTDSFSDLVSMALAGEEIPAVISNDGYGWLITVQRPYIDDGKLISYVCVDISMDDIVQNRYHYLFTTMIILLTVTALFSVAYVILYNRVFVKPIKQMTRATSAFVADREKDNVVTSTISELNIKTGDEIQTLSESLKTMEVDLIKHIENLRSITAEKERIGAELDVATRIQASMLPCIFPAFPDREEFEVYATMNPAKEVGGDFYDFFMVDEDNLAVVVADVSGKGVPAALFMVIGKTLIKDHTTSGKDLGEVFTEVNRLLCEANSEELFITAFVGVLNLKTGNFRYVNAGHEIPFIAKKNGIFEPYKIRAAFVLAGMEGIRYKSGELQLEPGDKLFQYTDGVTEATDKDDRLFGMERLKNTLAKLSDKTPTEILPGVKADIDAFVGDAPQFDDITMLCLEYRGAPSSGKTVDLSLENIAPLTEYVEQTLRSQGASDATVIKMNVALDEIYSNIVKFSGASYAKITCKTENGSAVLRFEDDGIPYDPLQKEDTDITLSAEEREIGGLGILMVKKSMDKMEYTYENGKNILTLTKKL